MADDTLKIPEGLSKRGRQAARAILELLQREERTETGGCRAFYTPKEWVERGEQHAHRSLLIVVHDGGDLGRYFNYDAQDYKAIERMDAALDALGLYAESCTWWYSAVYVAQPKTTVKTK